jgi:hypothetical protein
MELDQNLAQAINKQNLHYQPVNTQKQFNPRLWCKIHCHLVVNNDVVSNGVVVVVAAVGWSISSTGFNFMLERCQ